MIDQRFASHAALLLRLGLGTMWITHALLKVLVFTVSGFQGFLASHDMPAALALPIIAIELIGGALIVLGIHGRLVSLLLLPVLIGATAVHAANGWVFSNPQGGWEYPVFLMAMSIVHGLLGDGAFSVRSASKAIRAKVQTA